MDAGPLAVGCSASFAWGGGGWLAHSREEVRACTPELLSLPLEICYSTTFLLQSPGSSLPEPELGGQHPRERPSLSQQPPTATMQIPSSFIARLHKSFYGRRHYSAIKKWLKPFFFFIPMSRLIIELSEFFWLYKIRFREKAFLKFQPIFGIFNVNNPFILTSKVCFG